MTTTITNPAIREAVLKEVLPLHTAYEADIRTDGPAGEAFFISLYDAWVERIDYSDAWGLLGDDGYGADYDARIDLFIELARSGVDGLVWNTNYGQVWTDVRGWEYDGEVADLAGQVEGSIARIQVALTLLAERFLEQLHGAALEVAERSDV